MMGKTEKEIVPTTNETALEVLSQMPPVSGDELEVLLTRFHRSVERVAGDKQAFEEMCGILGEINPHYEQEEYSRLPKANVLANVVAGFYAPLIHGFTQTVLENVEQGRLPRALACPPRDTIPLVNSLQAASEIRGQSLELYTPPITRKVAGIEDNQADESPCQDPLFPDLIRETYGRELECGRGVTELEPGIYSTTSLKVADLMSEFGCERYVALKFYGLGPNLSYVHGLLSEGQEWVAERAELTGVVEGKKIADLMVFLDSIEEFGMQNFYQSVCRLQRNRQGRVVPVIEPVSDEDVEIAFATNKAVVDTADCYTRVDILDLSRRLLGSVPELREMAGKGYPFMLEDPIPPMDDHEEHFGKIRERGVLDYPDLILEK